MSIRRSQGYDHDSSILYIAMTSYRTDLKTFHFQTPSYAYHKIADTTLTAFDLLLDKFFEVLQSNEFRIKLSNDVTIKVNNMDVKSIVTSTRSLGLALMNYDNPHTNFIRDEIIGLLDQFLYLLSFK